MNILSYIGMNLQSEVCLWTLLGLFRTIFDATLFKVNANLKQVWQMSMPSELSLPIQRVIRTMISGVMLVQCFTVYVYLASYIVLLYPVFLEERPTLVLPWLLLAAIRKLLCELTSLALGLGTCVLLGPARPPCIKFLVIKILTIIPAFYMWTLVFGYYHTLKMAAAFKTFPTNLPVNDNDCGLELAVRRRRTKSLQGEDQVRKKLIANFYSDRPLSTVSSKSQKIDDSPGNLTSLSSEEINVPDILQPLSITSNRTISDTGTYEDWFGSEVVVPRDTDRIHEQFVIMLLRIGVYLMKDNVDAAKLFNSSSLPLLCNSSNIQYNPISQDNGETPSLVGHSQGKIASYLRDYPNIFMKKPSDVLTRLHSEAQIEPGNNQSENLRSESVSSNKSTKDISLGPNQDNFQNNSESNEDSKKDSSTELYEERRDDDFIQLRSKRSKNQSRSDTNQQDG
ncbi:uncharacterized protein LOC123715604 isoform X2 [Pieris brassicae]|uniref:uncharacterized protein LOC123715604 isoform X2 n=1 Tax=Pieris brassicae TaxID=7116 RepID=UPI001E6610BE|nr:uncharacterized protein LOC123715604 isoform X2 [Pieris brassicae]